jgi:hypothetical protein
MRWLTCYVVMVAVALAFSDRVGAVARADEARGVRDKVVRKACTGRDCAPYAPCGARCRIICPDGYSCHPLYGAYGPYGGVGFWGAYTYSGWGRGW